VSIIIFLILCVGVLASILISYGISRPIFHLVEQTKAIDLDQTTVIEVQGPREILFLGHSLNHMAQRLRRSKQSLEDHKDRLERELYSASQTQRSLLPEHLPHPSHLDIAFYWQPAQELGGDFYTTMPVSETKSVIILGDVVGKGASAAMAGALTLGLMELSIRSDSGPDVMLSQLNQHLCARFNSSQVTVSCTYVVFDHNSYELAIANAGCIFPIIVREGDLHYVEAPGSPLGLWEKATYDTHKVTLKPNDLFLLSSDGLVEANNRTRELFGFERLESVLRHIPLQDTASAVIDQLLSHMKDFAQGAPLSDDITLIAIRARDVDI
ncbi:MAG: SpoIIE family protein phosphatase, partial [Chloroflexota bacterium]